MFGNSDPSIRQLILNKITENCYEIIQDPYGNYIIQYILEIWGAETCTNILHVIQENIVSLSLQKYSSNVVEKCFDLIDGIERNSLIEDVFNHSNIICLIKNKYGNYVLQKALQMMSFNEKNDKKAYLNDHMMTFHKKDKIRLKEFIDVI